MALNENIQLERKIENLVHSKKDITANSSRILRTYADMTLLTRMTQGIMDITFPNDRMIPTDIIKVIG